MTLRYPLNIGTFMSSNEMVRKHHTRQANTHVDIKTATSLFYIGLIALVANLMLLSIPPVSLFLILILFVQKRWKINNSLLKMALLLALLPLLVYLSVLAFQIILILLLSGISSLGSGVYIEFSKFSEMLYIVSDIFPAMMALSIALISAVLLILNIVFPICKIIIRITLTPLLLALMLTSFLFGLFGGLKSYADSVNYLSGEFKNPVELIIDKKVDDYHIRAYRTDYEGALGSFGVEVKQEKDLPFQLKLVKYVSNYYHCDTVQLDVLNNHSIRIKPNIYSHNTNADISLPKIFYLKPFYETNFLKFVSQK